MAAIHVSDNTTSSSDHDVIKTKLRRSVDVSEERVRIMVVLPGPQNILHFSFFSQNQRTDPALHRGLITTTLDDDFTQPSKQNLWRLNKAWANGKGRWWETCSSSSSSLESMYYVWMNHRSKKPSNNAALRGLLVFWPLWNECMAFLERTETARGQSSFSLFFSDFITTIRGTWCVRGCVGFVCSFSFSSSFLFDVKKMLKSFFFSFLVGFRFLKLGLSSHWD